MSKNKKPKNEAVALMQQLTGTDQPIVGEQTFEQIKETNLKELESLRNIALTQLQDAARLGMCIKTPEIAQSTFAPRAAQLVGQLTRDLKSMNGDLERIREGESQLNTMATVEDYVPVALQLGEEHHLWQNKFSTGVVPVLEELKDIVEAVHETPATATETTVNE